MAWEPVNDAERLLAMAADADDGVAYFGILATCVLHLPAVGADPVGWDLAGARFVPAFTSPELLARWSEVVIGEVTASVTVRLPELLAGWPDPSWQLAVDPGTPIEVYVPLETVAVAGRHGVARPPVTLQKVLPHGHVDLYLSGGYRRVAGFVYPYEDVRTLTTPATLYDGLGLLHDRTGFAADDEHVHVLRWDGHCAGLYRLARGGRDEGAIVLMGGWVVEAPPFVGNGVGPGTVAAAELKVDSAVVPHGARIWRLDRFGREEAVAVWDADRDAWTRLSVGPNL